MTANDVQRLQLAASLFDSVIDQIDLLVGYATGEAAEVLRRERLAISAAVGRVRLALEATSPPTMRGGQHRASQPSPGDF